MSKRDPHLYCEDILDSGNAILSFVEGISFDDFCNDRKTCSAVIREFEIIGEAVGKLPESSFVTFCKKPILKTCYTVRLPPDSQGPGTTDQYTLNAKKDNCSKNLKITLKRNPKGGAVPAIFVKSVSTARDNLKKTS